MSTTTDRGAATGHDIGWLDFIKGFAIFWIIWLHIDSRLFGILPFGDPYDESPPLTERLQQFHPVSGHGVWSGPLTVLHGIGGLGGEGVQLFLIASGFGLTWSLLRQGGRPLDWRGYYLRRFWRIYPMWWLAHIVMMALGVFGPPALAVDPTHPGVWASVLGLRIGTNQMYVFAASWWFIGMIIQFYAVFPAFYWIFTRLGWRRYLAIMLPLGMVLRALGLWLFAAPLAGMHYLDAWGHGAIFLSRLSELVLGMALAGALHENPRPVQRVLSSPSVLLGAILVYPPALALSLTVVGNALSSVLIAVANLILVRAVAVAAERWLPRLGVAMRWCAAHSLSLCLVNSVVINLMIPQNDAVSPARIPEAIALIIVVALALEAITTVATHLAAGRWQFGGQRA